MNKINVFATSSDQDDEEIIPSNSSNQDNEEVMQEEVQSSNQEEVVALTNEGQEPSINKTQQSNQEVVAPIANEDQKSSISKVQSVSTTSSFMVIKMAELSVEELIQPYLDAMRPNKPITMQEAAEQTESLYRLMESIFKNNTTQEAFNAAWSKFLSIVKQYRDEHFHETKVYRGVPQWSLGNIAYTKFTRLTQLALETCDEGPNSKFLRTINLDRFFTEGFSEEDKQKIMGFYHLA